MTSPRSEPGVREVASSTARLLGPLLNVMLGVVVLAMLVAPFWVTNRIIVTEVIYGMVIVMILWARRTLEHGGVFRTVVWGGGGGWLAATALLAISGGPWSPVLIHYGLLVVLFWFTLGPKSAGAVAMVSCLGSLLAWWLQALGVAGEGPIGLAQRWYELAGAQAFALAIGYGSIRAFRARRSHGDSMGMCPDAAAAGLPDSLSAPEEGGGMEPLGPSAVSGEGCVSLEAPAGSDESPGSGAWGVPATLPDETSTVGASGETEADSRSGDRRVGRAQPSDGWGAGERRALDLVEVAGQAEPRLRLLMDEGGAFQLDTPDRLPAVEGDPDRLQDLLLQMAVVVLARGRPGTGLRLSLRVDPDPGLELAPPGLRPREAEGVSLTLSGESELEGRVGGALAEMNAGATVEAVRAMARRCGGRLVDDGDTLRAWLPRTEPMWGEALAADAALGLDAASAGGDVSAWQGPIAGDILPESGPGPVADDSPGAEVAPSEDEWLGWREPPVAADLPGPGGAPDSGAATAEEEVLGWRESPASGDISDSDVTPDPDELLGWEEPPAVADLPEPGATHAEDESRGWREPPVADVLPGSGATPGADATPVVDESLGWQESPAVENPPMPDEGDPGVQPRVLLVDDDAIVLELMAEILSSVGLSVAMAHGGEEGLEVFRRYRHTIELVVTDVSMFGMDGLAFVQAVTQLRPDVWALFVSGFVESEPLELELQRERRSSLQKPFTVRELRQAVEAIMGTSKGGPEVE